MYTQILTAAALATMAAAAPAASSNVWHVRAFSEICTESIPQRCVSTFNVTLNTLPTVTCHVDETKSNYQECGVVSPEQVYYAKIAQPSNKQKSKVLFVEFTTEIPGSSDTTYGNHSLANAQRNFDFPASREVHSN